MTTEQDQEYIEISYVLLTTPYSHNKKALRYYILVPKHPVSPLGGPQMSSCQDFDVQDTESLFIDSEPSREGEWVPQPQVYPEADLSKCETEWQDACNSESPYIH